MQGRALIAVMILCMALAGTAPAASRGCHGEKCDSGQPAFRRVRADADADIVDFAARYSISPKLLIAWNPDAAGKGMVKEGDSILICKSEAIFVRLGSRSSFEALCKDLFGSKAPASDSRVRRIFRQDNCHVAFDNIRPKRCLKVRHYSRGVLLRLPPGMEPGDPGRALESVSQRFRVDLGLLRKANGKLLKRRFVTEDDFVWVPLK